jgi:hypothetical protein
MGLLLKRSTAFGSNDFRKWYEKIESGADSFVNGKVCLFSDEFNYYDVSVGIDAYELLTALGYEVIQIMKKAEELLYPKVSGRSKKLQYKCGYFFRLYYC